MITRPMKWRLSVRIKYPALFMLATALPVVVLGVLTYTQARGILRDEIFSAELVAARSAATLIQAHVEGARRTVAEVSVRPGLRAAVERRDYEFVNRVFRGLTASDSDFRSFVLLGPTGVVLAVESRDPSLIPPGVIGTDRSQRDYFRRAVEGKEPYVSDVFVTAAGNPAVIVSAPILAPGDEVLGVVGGALSLTRIHSLLREVAETVSAFGILVDKRGVLIAHPKAELVARRQSFATLPYVQEALAGRSGTQEAWNSVEQEQRLVGYVPVRGLGWAVLISSPLAQVYTPIRRLRGALLTIAGLVVGAALLVSVRIGIGIARPLDHLAAAAGRLADGDLSASVDIRRRDEFGRLGNVFNTMAARLAVLTRNLEAQVEDRTRDLDRQRAHLEAVLAGIGDGVCVTDATGHVLMWNRAAETITGMPAAAMVGTRFPGPLRLVREDAIVEDFSQTTMKLALERGESITSTETRVARPDGTRVPIAMTAAPVRDSSEVVKGCVEVFRDVSREREIDRMKSEFVSTVSHELRTPLTSIRAYAETLRDLVGEDPTVLEFLTVIEEESVRLTRLINDLLNLSRIESGRVQFKREAVALEPLVRRVVQISQPRAAASDVRIEVDVPGDLPPVRGDGDSIQQVLTNLIDNGIKYNRRGGRVAVRAWLDGGVAVEVRDTGLGMSPSAVRRLGERFFRVDSSETRRVGGTGLGVRLVTEVLAAHGAKLEVESEEGKGSAFRFVLPLAGGEA